MANQMNQHIVSITLSYREARSTIWKCRLTKTLPQITDLKDRLNKQIATLILTQKITNYTGTKKALKKTWQSNEIQIIAN